MNGMEHIIKHENTETIGNKQVDPQAREIERKFDEWANTDVLAKLIDKNNDTHVSVQEYNNSKKELEEAYASKHNWEQVQLKEIHDETVEFQWNVINSFSWEKRELATAAVNRPFQYAQSNIIEKRNREHGVIV